MSVLKKLHAGMGDSKNNVLKWARRKLSTHLREFSLNILYFCFFDKYQRVTQSSSPNTTGTLWAFYE